MKGVIAALITLSIAGGCATTRGVVDLDMPEQSTATPAIPANAPGVYIASISDARKFEIKPDDPSIPSLKDGQITDTEITSRAIARKRNSYGMALGDILLPEGKTVVDVVREQLTASLAESGYRVTASQHQEAIPLEVSIEEFWAWFTPGFWAAKVEFRARLAFSGEFARSDAPNTVQGYAHQRHQAATSGAWLQTMEVGLQDLRKNLSDHFDNRSSMRKTAAGHD